MRTLVPLAMPMALLTALTVSVVVACGSPTGTAGVRRSPVPRAAAVPQPSLPASPTLEATFPCRLPIAFAAGASKTGDRLPPPKGAFITVPGGTVSTDPSGATSWGSPDENSIDMLGSPRLHGYGGPSYVAGGNRWVPGPSNHLSADGLAYAYAGSKTRPAGPNTETRLHIVQAATGADRVYEIGGQKAPVAFDAAGVYLVEARWEGSPAGLWQLDPASGQLRTIRQDGAWTTVANRAAWGSLGSHGMGEPLERVDRLDLATGRTELWLSRPGAYLQVLGVDLKGRPLVQINSLTAPPESRVDVVLLEAPGQARTLFSVPAGAPATGALADGHGIWFLTPTKVLLYREGTGLQEIMSISTLGSFPNVSLAGPCA
jgi:hypothetical protein